MLILIAAPACAAPMWYFASPYWTLRQIRVAAEEKDGAALSRYIDFPAVRENLKADFTMSMVAEMGAEEGEADLESIGAGLGMMMMAPLVDRFVSPAGIDMIFAKAEEDAAKHPPKPSDLEVPGDLRNVQVVRNGLSNFKVSLPDNPVDGTNVTIFFARHGLGWKVERVRLPMEEVDALEG